MKKINKINVFAWCNTITLFFFFSSVMIHPRTADTQSVGEMQQINLHEVFVTGRIIDQLSALFNADFYSNH